MGDLRTVTAHHSTELRPAERAFLLASASIWIGLTGWLDYETGVELRIFPLYFLPIVLVGWRSGYVLTLFMAWLSAATWLLSNYQAGMQYSHFAIWVVNTLTQAVSFSTIGVLVVYARRTTRLAEARSRTDSLTGLLNSAAFTSEAARIAAMCERHKRPLTLAYLDLDDFKLVNDRHGHAAGDAVLAQVGTVLRASVRETDLAARLGGDEFALALAETDELGAHVMLRRLREGLHAALQSAPRPVTVSVGAVVTLRRHAGIEDLLKAADKQLYEAKARGKDQFVVTAIEP